MRKKKESHEEVLREIARLERELGIGVEEQEVMSKPALVEPRAITSLAEYVGHKQRIEESRYYSPYVAMSAFSGPIVATPGKGMKLRTIYGPNGEPLYDTPAR